MSPDVGASHPITDDYYSPIGQRIVHILSWQQTLKHVTAVESDSEVTPLTSLFVLQHICVFSTLISD